MAASDESVAVSADFSSDSSVSDGWQELTKSDYAKVIFSDILCNAASSTIECKFQITDNVHEDPNDYVGLFRVGYEDLSQCLVSKMLSQTKCEDDGKLQRCVFLANELPCFDDGFYQFLYVTRDQEVCGASTPFKINMFQLEDSSVEVGTSEKMDGGFLLVDEKEERKMKVDIKQENPPIQQNALSQQKKEEIAAWVSRSPDYEALNQQLEKQNCMIHALQLSKDIAMKEITRLHGIVTTQQAEVIHSENMLAACKEKMKLSFNIHEEKTNEIIQLRSYYEGQLVAERRLRVQTVGELNEMKKYFEGCREKLSSYQLLQNEHQTEITDLKKKLAEMKEMRKTKECHEHQTEIADLKKRLEEMKQKKDDSHEVTPEIGRYSIENVIQKAKDLVSMVGDTIKHIDFADEAQVNKFFELKTQFLILSSKMQRASDTGNLCVRDGFHKEIHSIIEREVKGNSSAGTSSCALEVKDLTLPTSTVNVSEGEKSDDYSFSSIEISSSDSSTKEVTKPVDLSVSSIDFSSSDSHKEETASEDTPMDGPITTCKKSPDSEILEHQKFQLPHLQVITNQDNALTSELPLDMEDISVLNRLTEKIMKNGFNVHEAIEVIDDSSSDSESDVSEISDCTSIKKDLLCVNRVMGALSSLHNRTSLEQLVVVEDEEDKNLKCKNQWSVLLKKCALHYQIAILLEYIEKQKEGIKKVSDKICELLTQCMLLKDEVSDSKATCEKLEFSLGQKDKHISQLKGELEFKNDVLHNFCFEKEELKKRVRLAEQTIDDFHARILEASNLYKMQFTKIGKLSKKLQKYKTMKDMAKDCEGETSLSPESSTTASSFEVVQTKSVQKVSDSDTGEHMFEKASIAATEDLTNDDGFRARYFDSFKNKSSRFGSGLDVSSISGASKNDKEQFSAKVPTNSQFSMNGSVFVDQKLQFDKTQLTSLIQQLEKKNCIAPKFLRILKEQCNKIHEPMAFSACLRNVADALKLPAKSSTNKQKSYSLINKTKTLEQELQVLKQNLASYEIKINQKDAELKEAYKSLETIQAQRVSNNELETTSENCPDLCLTTVDDLLPSIHELKIEDSAVSTTAGKPTVKTAEIKSCQASKVFSDFSSYGHFQEIIKEQFVNIKNPTASWNSQECSIVCYVCKDVFPFGPEEPSDLMTHLEDKHSMKICPICGQLFEDQIPPRYFQIHVQQHFETE